MSKPRTITLYEYRVSRRHYHDSRPHEDDLMLWIPRKQLPEIIESLARQLTSHSRKAALVRFYVGRLYKGKTLSSEAGR